MDGRDSWKANTLNRSKPTLVIVNGPPASGKTSIVEQVANSLGLPLFTKDAIKERFADALGEGAFEHASELGKASQLQLVAIATELIRAGHGVVVESFFHKGITEPEFAPLIEQANAVMLHVTADEDTLVKRYAERMDDPSRHGIHNTDGTPDKLRKLLAEGLGDPLDLGCPLIVLDTTDTEYDEAAVARLIRDKLAEYQAPVPINPDFL